MKLKIVGASNFVNRMFEACGNYQWSREFLTNSIEGGATRVEFGIEWQAVEKFGVYRRTIIDDGVGMSEEELLKFFSTLGESGKKVGTVHDNFGVGAKIAALPWNPEGVVVISYKNGIGRMIRIQADDTGNEYELTEYDSPEGTKCAIDPAAVDWAQIDDIDWAAVRPAWLKDHGTVVVLLGSEKDPDTVRGNPQAGETEIKGLSVYLNTRYWDLNGVEVKVSELRSEHKNQWPQSPDDKEDTRRPNNRSILGARHFINYTYRNEKSAKGKAAAQGVIELDEGRVRAEWYLWEGERPHVDSYAKKGGFIAVRYKGELFEVSSHKTLYRAFGIVESQVITNLSIILEPDLYVADEGGWGVHPDQSRNRLIFTGEGVKGEAIPMAEWGREFADHMPSEIFEAIQRARGEISGSLDDDEYRKRLQDKFGSRWTQKIKIAMPTKEKPIKATDEADAVEVNKVNDQPKPERQSSKRKKKTKVRVVLKQATEHTGQLQLIEREVPVDVPVYRYASKDEFEKPWHIAMWVPNDPQHPTVVLNRDSPVIEEVIRYHRDQYPDVYAEQIAETIRHVFGEVAVAKIAHSQRLVHEIAEEELNIDYRSEQALTLALMGLLAEESLISQRLGKFGQKRKVA